MRSSRSMPRWNTSSRGDSHRAVRRDLDRHAGAEVARVERRGGSGANDVERRVFGDAGPLEQCR